MFWDRARKRARKRQNAKSSAGHMVMAGNRLGAVRGLPARLRADMFRAAYRVQRRFVRFCASAHRNRSRLPASVRKCDCAEMHIIPIADQLPESRPIAYQDITHVNDMRSALARPPARPLAVLPGQSATRHAARSVSDATLPGQSARDTLRSQRQAMRDTWRIAVSGQCGAVSGRCGAVSSSQRKSGAGKCSKISDLG